MLVIGIGNPSRGDDALGPLLIERLAALGLPDVELLTDFQLQVEYVLDLAGREEVIFVDASVACEGPFRFEPVQAAEDASHSTHALSPAALLAAYLRYHGKPPPPAHILAIRGRAFELGEELSEEAAASLESALAFLAGRLGRHAARV